MTRAVALVVLALGAPALADKSRLVSGQGDLRAEGSVSPVEQEVTVVENLGQRLPLELPFTDHTGQAVTLGQYFPARRPVIITPVYYTCPTLCSVVLQGLVGSLKASGMRLGEDYDLLTYSIDPKETPADAAEKRLKLMHALGFQAGLPEWPFLVGGEASSRALSEALGFRYRYDAEVKQYAHAASFMVLTPTGVISRYLYGVRYPPRDLRLAVLEAGEGKTGTAFDRFIMTCFRYDPASRRYELFLSAYIKGGALFFAAGLFAFLAFFWRREFKYGHGGPPPPASPSADAGANANAA